MSNAKFKMDVGLPKDQKSMWIYKTKSPSEKGQLEKTKSVGDFLGLKGKFSETLEKSVVEDGTKVMERFKKSGAIWYGDKSKMEKRTLEVELPSKETVKDTVHFG